METVVTPGPRTWYGRRTYAVNISDPTGSISFHGYSRKDADSLARVIPTLIGQRPIGPIAALVAREMLGRMPRQGEGWAARL